MGVGQYALVQFDQQPSAFADVRITKDRLKEDVGVAYFRASTDVNAVADNTDAKQLLDNSHKHLSGINRNTSSVAMDIKAVEQRMSGLQY